MKICSRFVFELVIWPQEVTLARWTQPSGPLCLWQCFYITYTPTVLFYPAVLVASFFIGIKVVAVVIHTKRVQDLSVIASGCEGNLGETLSSCNQMLFNHFLILCRPAWYGYVWKRYDSLSDVGESRVWFASKNLTPCRTHWNDFLIAQIIAKCHSFPNLYDML